MIYGKYLLIWFDLHSIHRLWDEEVGCESFRKKHENILSLYSFKTQEYWPRSEAFQVKVQIFRRQSLLATQSFQP